MILLGGVPLSSALHDPSWFEHVDLMQVLVTALIAYAVWTIRKFTISLRHDINSMTAMIRRIKDALITLSTEHVRNHSGSSVKVAELYDRTDTERVLE